MKQFNKLFLRPFAFAMLTITSTLLFSCNDASTATDVDTTKTEIVVPDTVHIIDTVPASPMKADSLVPTDTIQKRKLHTRPETQNTSATQQQ